MMSIWFASAQRYRSPVESALVGGILGGLLGWLFGNRRRGSG